jgi:hypothetical protein
VNNSSRSAVRLSLAACLGLLLLLPAGAFASSGVVVHKLPSAAPGNGAKAYWTAKRMRAAEPLPVRKVAPSGSPATPLSAPAGPNAAAPATVDRSRTIPGHPPVGQRIHPSPPYQSGEVPLANQTIYPTSTNGRIFGKFQGIGQYSCSATVVSSKSQSVIMTAGHCVFDEDAGFASKIVFVPAYHDGDRPFGIWAATNAVIGKGYFKILNPNNDYAALRVKSATGNVGAVVGEEGLAYSQPRGQAFQVIGYPFNLGKTELMWNCVTSFAGVDNHDHFPGKPDSGVGCDMTEGASGGGWTIFDAQGVPYLNSVTSYGYPQLKKVIFGPYLTKKASKIVNEANG